MGTLGIIYLIFKVVSFPFVLLAKLIGLIFGGVMVGKEYRKLSREEEEARKLAEEEEKLREQALSFNADEFSYGGTITEEDIFPTIDEEDTVNLPIVREQVVNKTITEVDGVTVEETQSEITILSDDRIIIRTNGKETIVIKQDGEKQTIIINNQ